MEILDEDAKKVMDEKWNLVVKDDDVWFILDNFIIDVKKYWIYDARYDWPDRGKRERSKKKPSVIWKLARGLYMDFTIEQACALAWIVKDTYHRWKNEDPRFALDMKNAKHGQLMVAKWVVFNALKDNDTKVALDVLSKREDDYKTNTTDTDTNLVLSMNFIDNVAKVVTMKRIAENDEEKRRLKWSEENIWEVIEMETPKSEDEKEFENV